MKIAKLGASLLFSTRAPAIFIAVVVLNLPFARTKLTSSQMSVSLKNKHSQLMEEFDEPPSRSTLALCLFHGGLCRFRHGRSSAGVRAGLLVSRFLAPPKHGANRKGREREQSETAGHQ